jgi:hypothetical protein
MRVLLLLSIVAITLSCSTSQSSPDVIGLDLALVDLTSDGTVPPPADAVETRSDTRVDDVPDIPKPRLLKFRAIGGVSMGAGALNFHAHHPGLVDVVAALGGYVNYSYVIDMLHRQTFAGFCPREVLLAHLDELNDPDSPNLECGPLESQFPWEFAQNFNNIHPDYSGGTWDRDTYWDSIEALNTAFGNLFSYNPDHPLLPPGVPVEILAETDPAAKCANPVVVQKPFNYNAEYNPDGTYDLITFCDGEEPIPGGKDNPDYWSLMGAYDPTQPHTRPMHIILAVDYNGNGLRDYHEPLIINALERFQDTGTDGCADADEDGLGGCQGSGTGDDPNGDNFDTFDTPLGTEGDNIRQDGESWDDFGLDGVDGTDDFGEQDGEYSVSPHLAKLFDTTGMHWIATATAAELAATDVFLDAGIRDGLQSLTGTYRIASLLRSREPDTRFFDNHTGTAESVYPSNAPLMLNTVYEDVDWSSQGTGKNFLVTYGYEEATPAEVDAGDGKHVGSPEQIFNRVAMFIYATLGRWPNLDSSVCNGAPGKIAPSSFYSAALGSRFGYSISIPPCYDESDLDYPVIFFLPGQGMWAADVTMTNLLFNASMQNGLLPKFIEVAPEGQCCRVHRETGERYCSCLKSKNDGNMWDCVEPQCKKPHDECEIITIPKQDVTQECPGGCVFANQVADRFGNIESATHMLYEDMLLDLMDHVDATYRVRPPEVPEE